MAGPLANVADRTVNIPATMTLRDYQQNVINEYEQKIAAGIRRIIIVAPTGAGKTVIAAEIIRRACAEYNRVLFIAHRNELLTQARDKLKSFDIVAGIIKAGRDKDARPQAIVRRHSNTACQSGTGKDDGIATRRDRDLR